MTTIEDRRRERRADRDGFPHQAYPSGWFHIAWTQELSAGQVMPLHYFGRDLVLYRANSGEARVFDAACPHRGADLGRSGVVHGDDLACGNHGWCWNAQGRNVWIPRSERVETQMLLRRWPVREQSGLIFLWHDEAGGDPTWEPPIVPQAADPRYFPAYPEGAMKRTLDFPPHLVGENNADMAHLEFIHEWDRDHTLVTWEENGPHLHTKFSGTITTRRGKARVEVAGDSWGVGIVRAELDHLRSTVQMLCPIPVDRRTTDLRMSVWVARPPGGAPDAEPDALARSIYSAQIREVADLDAGKDGTIWANMIYVDRPPYAREEAKVFTSYRRWLTQFYAY
jgi:phenylpropionate dioxygenase-like ring-hydroxylating dioxygenase large terminal subunit